MVSNNIFNRITLIVLDGAGIGEMPDAADWGDAGSDTLGHILASREVRLPNLQRYGLGNIRPLKNLPPVENPRGCFGRCALRSNGKDTTTGHWEMAGIILEHAFPTYPNGFPQSLIDEFIAKTHVPGVLGNTPASGTETVLVVEDDEQVNRLAVEALAERGYRVLSASDGASAPDSATARGRSVQPGTPGNSALNASRLACLFATRATKSASARRARAPSSTSG